MRGTAFSEHCECRGGCRARDRGGTLTWASALREPDVSACADFVASQSGRFKMTTQGFGCLQAAFGVSSLESSGFLESHGTAYPIAPACLCLPCCDQNGQNEKNFKFGVGK